jgi:hypothetical protein
MINVSKNSWLIFLLLLSVNFVCLTFQNKFGVYDPSIFRLQLEYPLVNLKPYTDFVIYYPFGLSLISVLTHEISNGLLKFFWLVWPIHLLLQCIFLKKINEVIPIAQYKNLILIILVIETFFYAKLGTEPFSLLITLILLIEAFLCEKNKKVTWVLFSLSLMLIFLRLDRLFYSFLTFFGFLFICKLKMLDIDKASAFKILAIFIGSIIFFIGTLFSLSNDNFFEALNFIFLLPFEVKRSLDFHFDGKFFSNNNFFFLLLATYFFTFIYLLGKKKVRKYEIFLAFSGLVMLPYCIKRPDMAHLVPFYISSLFLLFFLLGTMKNSWLEKFKSTINTSYATFFSILYIGSQSLNVTHYLQKPLHDTCSDFKGDFKTVFVGNEDYSNFVVNAPVIYLKNLNIKPASRFISEDPGVQNSCFFGQSIVSDLQNAEKPTIFFINKTLIQEKYSSNKFESCGLIEKYVHDMTIKIGSCNVGKFEFDVRTNH